MAGKEGQPQPNSRETTGKGLRNTGIVIAAIGLIAEYAALVIGGTIFIAGGEVMRRSGKAKKKG